MQPSQTPASQPMDLKKAILVGQLIVNGPAMLIMAGLTAIGYFLFRGSWPFFAIAGVIIGWLWWSISVPRWRNWAVQQGCDPNELHESAVATGLEWPKGVIFEKTEIKPKIRVGEAGSNGPFSTLSSEQLPKEEMADAAIVPTEQPLKGQPFFIRGMAYLIDGFVLMAVFFPVEFITILLIRIFLTIFAKSAGIVFEPQQASAILAFILIIALDLVYLVVYTWLAGATPGKLILKMRVVAETGERVGFKASLIRSGLSLIDSMVLGIVAYFKMKPPLYQRNGDRLAKTIVVGSKDPGIKQGYSKKRFLASSGIFLMSAVLAALIMGVSTIGPVYPLVKIPAAQLNLQISDFPEKAERISDARATSVTDGNLRNFAVSDHMVYSEVMIFNSFLSDTNAALKQSDDNIIKKVFKDPEIRIEPAIEYTSGYRGFIQKFSSTSKEIEGYSAFLLKKNVSIHLLLYGEPGVVTMDEVQRLKDIILARIP